MKGDGPGSTGRGVGNNSLPSCCIHKHMPLSPAGISFHYSLVRVCLSINPLYMHQRGGRSHPRSAAVRHSPGKETRWRSMVCTQKATVEGGRREKVYKTRIPKGEAWLCTAVMPTFDPRQEIWWIREPPCPGWSRSSGFVQAGTRGGCRAMWCWWQGCWIGIRLACVTNC